jgi:hypothetical protein
MSVWARLTALGCPVCHVEVLELLLPTPPMIWCSSCPGTPRLERTAT